MREEEKGILNNIKSVYGNLTTLEKEIADFFLNGPDIKDFSAQNVAAHLFISTPSLTRFAQKCGYSGYRDRKSTRLNSSHGDESRMPSSA